MGFVVGERVGGRLGRRGFNTINSGGGGGSGGGVLGVFKLKMVADLYEERDRVEEWTSGKPGEEVMTSRGGHTQDSNDAHACWRGGRGKWAGGGSG